VLNSTLLETIGLSDELRRVYWKALARGKLAVKEFESEISTYVLFVLALGRDNAIRSIP
jgi:uncharacterized protein (DUF58 family)